MLKIRAAVNFNAMSIVEYALCKACTAAHLGTTRDRLNAHKINVENFQLLAHCIKKQRREFLLPRWQRCATRRADFSKFKPRQCSITH
jgi:hypothetical protein